MMTNPGDVIKGATVIRITEKVVEYIGSCGHKSIKDLGAWERFVKPDRDTITCLKCSRKRAGYAKNKMILRRAM